MSSYIEFHCHSNYSFLDGASFLQELLVRAKELDMPALALTDHDGLYGMVKFIMAAREIGIRPIIGTELTLDGGYHLTLLAKDQIGYSNLCRLVTRAQLDHEKGDPSLAWNYIEEHTDGLLALSGCHRGEIAQCLIRGDTQGAVEAAQRYLELFGPESFWIEVQRHMMGYDHRLSDDLIALAQELRIGYVATNNVHYAAPESRPLQDVLTSIRHNAPLDELGDRRYPNSEFYLKSAEEMVELFLDHPEAVTNSLRIAEECQLDPNFTQHRLPKFPLPKGITAIAYLRWLCYEGARRKYQPMSRRVIDQLDHELSVIHHVGLEDYFLLVWDICRYAHEHDIPAQGRGSAAGSIVAYVLDITRVDPIEHDLLFERFLSEERGTIPDIDIDFSREGREEVIQYVYRRYGEDHAAMVCTVITFQARSAIREVGKSLGFPPDLLDKIAKSVYGFDPETLSRAVADVRGNVETLPWQHLISLCQQIWDYPRHLSVHVGGMIITGSPLVEVIPLERARKEGIVVTQVDKDDIADLGLIKTDLLSLATLSLVKEAVELAEETEGVSLDMDSLAPFDDPAIYEMICEPDTIGLFQVESRAQIQMLPKMQPRKFSDIVVEVAIVRPGPIQGKMIHPYLQRRQGLEKVTYPHPKLEPVLKETLGVIIFQEQVLRVASVIGGFTPGEGELLRRAMSRKRSYEEIEKLRAGFVKGTMRNGLPQAQANQVFDQLAAFGGYGFCKSHAAAFARTTYETAYLKLYHPLAFYTALLNNQPMGFYAPCVIVEDAKRHGITVLPVDINKSQAKCTVENGALRLGFEYVDGIGEAALKILEREREKGPYSSLREFCERTILATPAIEKLIMVGAFDSLGIPRRDLLWQLGEVKKSQDTKQMALSLAVPGEAVSFKDLSPWEKTGLDYVVLGLTTGPHITTYYREIWQSLGVVASKDLDDLEDGQRVRVAGLVIVRQEPSTAKGHIFISLEDEFGHINVIVRPQVVKRYHKIVRREPFPIIEGRVVVDGRVRNVLAERFLNQVRVAPLAQSVSRDFR